jgi:transposase
MSYSVKHKMLTLHKVLPPENRNQHPDNLQMDEAGKRGSRRCLRRTLKTGVPDGIIPKEKSDLEKFSILLESRSIAEDKKGEWLRENGLHSEHLTVWEQELAKNMGTKTEDNETLKAANRKLEKDNRELQKELKRKEKALAEMVALYTLKKKQKNTGRKTGRKISGEDKCLVLELIEEAHQSGARIFKACECLGISVCTMKRWKSGCIQDMRKNAPKVIH